MARLEVKGYKPSFFCDFFESKIDNIFSKKKRYKLLLDKLLCISLIHFDIYFINYS